MKQTSSTRLRHERELRGWSRSYVAEQVEVDVATIGRWERGERLPYSHYRQKLCSLFELSAQDLGLISEPPEELAMTLEYDHHIPLQEPPTYENEKNLAPSPQLHRRKFLIGLGGLVAVALLIKGEQISTLHSSAPLTSPVGKRLAQFIDPNTSNWVNNLAWSPDGSMLAVANGIPMVTVWHVDKGALLNYYPTLNQWVNDVAWSNTHRIAAAIADSLHSTGAVQIWTFPGTSLPLFTLQRTSPLRTVSWSPDGEYLAFAGHGTIVEIWGPVSSNPVSRYLDAGQGVLGINRVKWSSDASYLAAAADDGSVHVWDVAMGTPRGIYQGHKKRVVDIAWLPDGHLIASASVDKTVQIWDALSGRNIVTYQRHTGEVHGVDWSPDGKYIVSTGYDTTAQVWEALTGKSIVTYNENSNGLCVLWSTDGRTVLLGSQKQGIEVWQAPSKR